MKSPPVEYNGSSKRLLADKSLQANSVEMEAWVWEIATYKKRLRLNNQVVDLEAHNQIMEGSPIMGGNQTIPMLLLMLHLTTVVRVSSAVETQIMIWIVIISSQWNRNSSQQTTRTTHGKNQRSLPSNYSTIISSLRRRRHLGRIKEVSMIITNTKGTTISLELTTSSSNTRTVIKTGNRDQQPAQAHSHLSSTPEIHPVENRQLLSDTLFDDYK